MGRAADHASRGGAAPRRCRRGRCGGRRRGAVPPARPSAGSRRRCCRAAREAKGRLAVARRRVDVGASTKAGPAPARRHRVRGRGRISMVRPWVRGVDVGPAAAASPGRGHRRWAAARPSSPRRADPVERRDQQLEAAHAVRRRGLNDRDDRALLRIGASCHQQLHRRDIARVGGFAERGEVLEIDIGVGPLVEEECQHLARARLAAATINGVRPSRERTLTSAPRVISSRVFAASSTAQRSAVAPASFFAFGFAPASSSARTSSTVPVERGIHQRRDAVTAVPGSPRRRTGQRPPEARPIPGAERCHQLHSAWIGRHWSDIARQRIGPRRAFVDPRLEQGNLFVLQGARGWHLRATLVPLIADTGGSPPHCPAR